MRIILVYLFVFITFYVKSQVFNHNDSILINYFNNISNHIKFNKEPPIVNLLNFNVNTSLRNREVYFSSLTDTSFIGVAKNLKGYNPIRKKQYLQYEYQYFVFDLKNKLLYLFEKRHPTLNTIIIDKNRILKISLSTTLYCYIYNKQYYLENKVTIRGSYQKFTSCADVVFYKSYKLEHNIFYGKRLNIVRRHCRYIDNNYSIEHFIDYFNDIILNNLNFYISDEESNWTKLDYSLYISKKAKRNQRKGKNNT